MSQLAVKWAFLCVVQCLLSAKWTSSLEPHADDSAPRMCLHCHGAQTRCQQSPPETEPRQLQSQPEIHQGTARKTSAFQSWCHPVSSVLSFGLFQTSVCSGDDTLWNSGKIHEWTGFWELLFLVHGGINAVLCQFPWKIANNYLFNQQKGCPFAHYRGLALCVSCCQLSPNTVSIHTIILQGVLINKEICIN